MHSLLKDLSIGDFIHAVGSQGGAPTCLILDKRDGLIFTRSVTTHIYIAFSESNGKGIEDGGTVTYQIDCIEKMPSDIQNVFKELDWKNDPQNLEYVITNDAMALTREQRMAIFYSSVHAKYYRVDFD